MLLYEFSCFKLVDESDELSLSYVRGTWNPMTILMFFDLLQKLSFIAPSARVQASPYTYSVHERQLFNAVWQDYVNAAP